MTNVYRIDAVLAIGEKLFGNQYSIELYKILEQFVSTGIYQERKAGKRLYHIYHHIFAVVITADKIAESMGLSPKERQLLFWAALFHDVYHTFGKQSDIINVCESVCCFMDTAELYPELMPQTKADVEYVADAIMCTVFPFRIRPKNDVECILRDADISMSLEDDIELFAEGLQNEMKDAGHEATVTPDTMLQFAKEQRFYTLYMANLFGIPYAYRHKEK